MLRIHHVGIFAVKLKYKIVKCVKNLFFSLQPSSRCTNNCCCFL